jgi:hypothetical protein
MMPACRPIDSPTILLPSHAAIFCSSSPDAHAPMPRRPSNYDVRLPVCRRAFHRVATLQAAHRDADAQLPMPNREMIRHAVAPPYKYSTMPETRYGVAGQRDKTMSRRRRR